ncbi:MAG: DUF4097 family beta strand repeat protein [Clostridia bacterium]|nr:DUF4097 family beta strand repeat protein [Clostridia bacterium]
MKKAFIIVAIVLIAAGIILFSSALIAADFDYSRLGTAKYETNSYTLDAPFQNIDITTHIADITFKPSADGTARVTCFEQTKIRHTVAVENGTLKIGAADERSVFERLSFFNKPMTITVYLPEIGFDNISIHTSTGDIRIDTLSAQELKLTTSTGDIAVNSVNCSGTLTATASTGDVLLDACTAAKIQIKTSTGDVRFDASDAADIAVKTSTGDVTGSLRTGKRFTVKTSTGDVSVPASTDGGNCEITTSTGDITIKISEYN